jgi:ABC-type glycerol-3-phosphate transport system substrate-binding protein
MTRKLSRREFLNMTAMMTAGVAIAACAPAVATTAPTTAPTTGVAATAVKAERRVEFWGVSSPAHEAAVKKTAEDIRAKTGLFIDYVRAPNGWPDQLQKLNAAIAAGTPPDIVHVKDFNMWDYAWRDTLLPLDSYFASSGIDTGKFRKSIWNAMHYKGTTYAAPWKGSFVWVQFINNDLFTAAGLDPAKDIPKKWDDVVSTSQKITGGGNFGHAFYSLGTSEPDFFLFSSYVGQAGGKVFKDGVLTLNTPEATEALQWMYDLIWTKKFALPPDQMQGVWDVVKSGKVGSWINGVWFVEEALATAPNLKWSIAQRPGYKTFDDVDTPECIIIPKGAKDPALSFEAIKLLLDPQIDLDHALVQGFLPAYQENLDRLPVAATKNKEALTTYAAIGRNPDLRQRQWTEGYDEIVRVVMPEIQAVWFNQKSVKDGLIAAETAGNKVITRIKETGR